MRLATAFPAGYCSSQVVAKSATGFDGPNDSRRTSAPSDAGAFFMPSIQLNGGRAWGTSGCAGFLESRSVNLRTATTLYRLTAIGGGSQTLGEPTMKHAPIASAIRARAHRKMAFAALRSDSSAAVRLKRYNHHMIKARRLEAREVRP